MISPLFITFRCIRKFCLQWLTTPWKRFSNQNNLIMINIMRGKKYIPVCLTGEKEFNFDQKDIFPKILFSKCEQKPQGGFNC